LRSIAIVHAAATSIESAGRTTCKPGIKRNAPSCSIGWCVGPSSPTKIESCVYTQITCVCMMQLRRMLGRM